MFQDDVWHQHEVMHRFVSYDPFDHVQLRSWQRSSCLDTQSFTRVPGDIVLGEKTQRTKELYAARACVSVY